MRTAAPTAASHDELASILESAEVAELGPGGLPIARIDRDGLVEALASLRDRAGYAHLALMTAEERLPGEERDDRAPASGVDLIYGLTRPSDRSTVLLRVRLDDADLCAPSATCLWPGAAPLEREVFDLFGVRFEGHPSLTRIVLRDDFEGHPLRKSFALGPSGVSAELVLAAAADPGAHVPSRRADDAACSAPGPSPFEAASEPGDPALRSERLVLNMGPQHPSMHGVLHLYLALDGEEVVAAEPTHGYLHRCIEKLCENRSYRACIALMDRCDYVSGFQTELAYCLALEELAGIEVTPKADFIRVLMAELVRITSHHTWYAAAGLDTGALTPFLYAFIDRELILDFFEEVTGARMMFNYLRPGGVKDDIPPQAARRLADHLRRFDRAVDEYEALLTDNEVFRLRTRGIGILEPADAIAYGVTGPMARASGVDIDLRRDEPYAAYDRIPVKVALGEVGDTYDRYVVRIAEMRESARIALAALEGMPEGPHVTPGVPRAIKPPRGAAYRRVESSRGELGIFLTSDGSAQPWRVKVRSPALSNLHAAPALLTGCRIGDVVAVLGSVDVVMGEIDR